MAYVNISNALLAVGKAMTSAIAIALRDNPVEIARGGVNAPRILGQAAARIGNGLPVLSVAAADIYGLNYGLTIANGVLDTETTAVMARRFVMNCYSGTVRIWASHRATSGTASLVLYRNGTAIATYSTTSGSFVQRVADVNVDPGDVIEFAHVASGASAHSIVENVYMTASNAYVPQDLLIPILEV
jgi:hypothetical protein